MNFIFDNFLGEIFFLKFFWVKIFFTPQLGSWGLRLRGLRDRAEEVDQGEVSTMILGMMSQQDSIHLYMNVVSVLKHSS